MLAGSGGKPGRNWTVAGEVEKRNVVPAKRKNRKQRKQIKRK